MKFGDKVEHITTTTMRQTLIKVEVRKGTNHFELLL